MQLQHTRVWTEDDKWKVAELVTSYVYGVGKALELFEVDQDELDDVLLDINIEQCINCGWYDDCFNLVPDDSEEPDGYCSNCRPK